jgi:hypothetical protein
MTDILVALLIGFIFGYGIRGLVSRRRRAEYRRQSEQSKSYTKEGV